MGLTRGESKVYLALVKLGNTSTGDLIKYSGVSRSKVYDVLEKLKQKGLVSEVIKDKIRHFEASKPTRITEFLIEKRIEIENKIEESRKIAKEIINGQGKNSEKQESRVYIGLDGWKTVYNEILEELEYNDEYLAFGIGKKEISTEEVNLFIKKFHLKREEKKVPARIIMGLETKEEMMQFPDSRFYKSKFTDIKFPTNIAIYKDIVLTLVYSDKPIAFLIKSNQVADKYRRYFEYVWKISKK